MSNKKEADSDYRGLILSLIMLGRTNADTVMKKRDLFFKGIKLVLYITLSILSSSKWLSRQTTPKQSKNAFVKPSIKILHKGFL